MPSDFINSVFNETHLFVRGVQNDAHEFLMFFIDYLRTALSQSKNLSINPIEEIFSGEIMNKTWCTQCEQEINYKETIFDLNIPVAVSEDLNNYNSFMRAQETNTGWLEKIKNYFLSNKSLKPNLKDYLEVYFEQVNVSDLKNLRQCDNCDQKTGFSIKTVISTFPKNLLVTLKKYGVLQKGDTSFPTDLNLSKYGNYQSNSNYKLYGLISHVGFNGLGHYKCYCKNHLDPKMWYCFNDAKISEIPSEEIRKIQAYIGFYELEGADYSFIKK